MLSPCVKLAAVVLGTAVLPTIFCCEGEGLCQANHEQSWAGVHEAASGAPLLQVGAAQSWSIPPLHDAAAEDVDHIILPKPKSIRRTLPSSQFVHCLRAVSSISYPNKNSALFESARQVYATTRTIPFEEDKPGSSCMPVELHLTVGGKEGSEDYKVNTRADRVDITADSEAGLFYGMMTLKQLCRKPKKGEGWEIKAVEIEDHPATEWRGVMLDVARRFFPASEVKQLLTLMATFKLNRFHWHLTDDQGWRLPVDDYPDLVKVGQKRIGSPKTQRDNEAGILDGVPHDGAYTKEDIEDVVKHAASLFIEIIPEVDMPGHVQAAIAAYPELGNTDADRFVKPGVAFFFGPQKYTLGPKEKSFDFVKSIIDTEVNLFPSSYLHLGGDEVSKKQWSSSDTAKEFLSQEGVSGSSEIEGYFHRLATKYALHHGRRPVLWEEAAMTKDLTKEAIMLLWKVKFTMSMTEYKQRVAQLTADGRDVILAPLMYTYLDFPEHVMNEEYENPMYTGSIPLQQIYNMPIPVAEGEGRVLGGQVQLWTEYIRSKEMLEYRTWPRACALAERLWVGGVEPVAPFRDFYYRVSERYKELQQMGLHVRKMR